MTHAVDTLACSDDERRERLVARKTVQGIDYVEYVTRVVAGTSERVLEVHFVDADAPDRAQALGALLARVTGDPERVTITGGRRVRDVHVRSVTRVGMRLELRFDRPGDHSRYRLRIEDDELDPAFSEVEADLMVECPSRFDCGGERWCPPEELPERPIDYMAKDYASFRQALIDLIPVLVPDWHERLEADLGMTLLELLAYVGDQLSYFQDAVANEAYLSTARKRVSVRRHARLVDYRVHDGLSARAFVHFDVASPPPGSTQPPPTEPVVVPAGTMLLTRLLRPLGGSASTPDTVITGAADVDLALERAAAVFETLAPVEAYRDLGEIAIHDWGRDGCCLPRGATEVDLVGDLTGKLTPGDYLLLEEVLGPERGDPAAADPSHRQVVRLTAVSKGVDRLPVRPPDALPGDPPPADVTFTHVEWDAADALRFPLCISAREGDDTIRAISVARGNLALAMHGRTLVDWHPREPGNPPGPGVEPGRRPYRFSLGDPPLGFRPPEPGPDTPAAALVSPDPRAGEPRLELWARTLDDATLTRWTARRDLLDSDPDAHDAAVETQDDGTALIRFGRDDFGMAPLKGTYFRAHYAVGVGTAGNVGAEAIAHAVAPGWPEGAIAAIRNPLPAFGGIDPEPLEKVRVAAPAAFRAQQLRAVTEADYARAAERNPEVTKAVASFRWTGSWMTVFVTVDRRGRVELDESFRERVRADVEEWTQAGYDVHVEPPVYVPLELHMEVCADRRHFRADVEAGLLAALGSRELPGRGTGFFHPDRHTFGQAVYVSELYAAAQAVEGVDSVVVTSLTVVGEPEGLPPSGALEMGGFQVARLDNDPSLPENGFLELEMLGGKG